MSLDLSVLFIGRLDQGPGGLIQTLVFGVMILFFSNFFLLTRFGID